MELTWLGHSSFMLSDSNGVRVVTDPYSSRIGYKMPAVSADIVTISHGHFDHNNSKAVGGAPVVLDREGAYDIKGIEMRSIHAWHDNAHGLKRGDDLIFKYRMDGLTLCHMGDIGEDCNDLLCKALTPIDVLMIPVGGTYTVTAAEAKKYVDKLRPFAVVPMHFKTDDCALDIAGRSEFLQLFDSENVVKVAGNSVRLDSSLRDGTRPKVFVLEKLF